MTQVMRMADSRTQFGEKFMPERAVVLGFRECVEMLCGVDVGEEEVLE